jgi:outer membrane protein assembly factor BamB/tRNA A-37 threonylcarbamoyl transferase component Bud32
MVDTRQFAREGDKSLLGIEGALQANSILQNRYRIEGVLGVGGMGSVYQARDMQFPDAKRYVAVKEMLQQSNDPELREMALRNFQREANLLAGLNHPAIPTIHDYFSTKERAYLVMEYINGSDLDTIISRHDGFLPVKEVVEWCIVLCDVLSYLHESTPPIIFRDVKPSNIMIDVHGRLRLIDFGIAKHFDPDRGKGTMIGTEGYAAPESYRGLATPSSDIFGIGATMHHIFTNHDPRLEPPFTFAERPIRAVNPEVPPELDAIVMKALAFSPDDRFATAKEMRDALAGLLRGGTTVLIASNVPATRETVSWEEAEATSSTGVEPRWKFKVEEEIRSTPACFNRVVYVTAYDNNLYAVDAETGQFKWKYPTDDVIASSPAIASDDNLVIFGSKDFSLYAVDMRTGRIKWTFQAQGPIYSSPTVQHGHVFVGSDDGTLYALRAATGRQAWKSSGHTPIRCKPAVTGERVLFGTRDGEVVCIDLSGQIKWRFKARREIISSPAVHNNIAYFGSMDGYIYAIDAETSWAIWKFQTGKPVISSPCLGEDKVFVGGANGTFYAFDAQSGRERWKFQTSESITSSPAFYQDSVYFGGNDRKIYCLEAKTGNLRWSYETDGVVPGSPTVVDGVVYIGSADQYLYAFKA